MDETYGELTTGKLQALVDASYAPGIRSRRDIAAALTAAGEKISIHGVEAWFRHVDSNYNLKRRSLNDRESSYRLPKRRWRMILDLFALSSEDLKRTDSEFRTWCFDQARSRKRATSAPPNDDRLAPPTGREGAWRHMTLALQRAESGTPSFVLLNGPEGTGKTHLLRRFAHCLQEHQVLAFHTACAAHTGLPLIPIVEMFRSDRGALLAAGEQFERQFQEIFERYAGRSVDGFEAPRTFLDVMSLLTGLARQHTVTLCIDDLHLADEATAAFLDYLAAQMRARADFRLLVIGAYRHGGGTSNARRLIASLEATSGVLLERLEPLDAEGLKRLLHDELDTPLSTGAFKQIWQFSRGRLGSAVELVHLLINRQLLCRQDGILELARGFDPANLPKDVTGIPLDALQQLSQEGRDLLTLASAIGIAFSLELLQELRPKWSLHTMLAVIEEAERLEILVHDRDQFRFSHAALAKTLYDSMTDTTRARVHLDLAAHLTRQDAALTDVQQIALAHHLRRAGPLVPGAAVREACGDAAWAAARLSAWPQVIEFGQAALGRGGANDISLEQHGSLLRLLASAWHQSGNPDAAIHCLRDALEKFRAIPNELEISRTLHHLVRIRGNFARLQPPDHDPDLNELIERTQGLAQHEPRLASRAYDAIAARMMFLGNRELALTYARKARAVVEHDGPSTEKALACIAVGLGQLRHLDLHGATSSLEDALYIALEVGDQHTAARSLQRLTLPNLARGRLDQVDSVYQRVAFLEHPLVRTGEMSIPMASQVASLALRGEFAKASTIFEEARALVNETGYFWSQINLYTAQAFALAAQGDTDQACALLDSLEKESGSRGGPGSGILSRYRRLVRSEAPSECPATAAENLRVSESPPPDGRELDLNALAKHCLDAYEVIVRNHPAGIEAAFDVLHAAYERGARFSLGWPFCVPHLMARALICLGRREIAAYYLIAAHQVCIESGAVTALRAIDETLTSELPELAAAILNRPESPPPQHLLKVL